MSWTIQPSAIDDGFDFIPERSPQPLPRHVNYHHCAEPGDFRSAVDDRCKTDYDFVPDHGSYPPRESHNRASDPQLPNIKISRSAKAIAVTKSSKRSEMKPKEACKEPVKTKTKSKHHRGIVIRSQDGKTDFKRNPWTIASASVEAVDVASIPPLEKSVHDEEAKVEVASSAGLRKRMIRIAARDGQEKWCDVPFPLHFTKSEPERTSNLQDPPKTSEDISPLTMIHRLKDESHGGAMANIEHREAAKRWREYKKRHTQRDCESSTSANLDQGGILRDTAMKDHEERNAAVESEKASHKHAYAKRTEDKLKRKTLLVEPEITPDDSISVCSVPQKRTTTSTIVERFSTALAYIDCSGKAPSAHDSAIGFAGVHANIPSHVVTTSSHKSTDSDAHATSTRSNKGRPLPSAVAWDEVGSMTINSQSTSQSSCSQSETTSSISSTANSVLRSSEGRSEVHVEPRISSCAGNDRTRSVRNSSTVAFEKTTASRSSRRPINHDKAISSPTLLSSVHSRSILTSIRTAPASSVVRIREDSPTSTCLDGEDTTFSEAADLIDLGDMAPSQGQTNMSLERKSQRQTCLETTAQMTPSVWPGVMYGQAPEQMLVYAPYVDAIVESVTASEHDYDHSPDFDDNSSIRSHVSGPRSMQSQAEHRHQRRAAAVTSRGLVVKANHGKGQKHRTQPDMTVMHDDNATVYNWPNTDHAVGDSRSSSASHTSHRAPPTVVSSYSGSSSMRSDEVDCRVPGNITPHPLSYVSSNAAVLQAPACEPSWLNRHVASDLDSQTSHYTSMVSHEPLTVDEDLISENNIAEPKIEPRETYIPTEAHQTSPRTGPASQATSHATRVTYVQPTVEDENSSPLSEQRDTIDECGFTTFDGVHSSGDSQPTRRKYRREMTTHELRRRQPGPDNGPSIISPLLHYDSVDVTPDLAVEYTPYVQRRRTPSGNVRATSASPVSYYVRTLSRR
ncbi:hypothetical protein AAFC00_003312 [Neodothiora populina]|uniref:Uncharacterized protein n=1 Tax=Neodothiora populina TaxID=2781224 RepID=A0ABR3PA06_9PEZI